MLEMGGRRLFRRLCGGELLPGEISELLPGGDSGHVTLFVFGIECKCVGIMRTVALNALQH